MSDGCDAPEGIPGGRIPMDEALTAIGEETRANILVELGDARESERARATVLSYSELMDRVGVEDSGRFNYHLHKLVGPFVKKVEEGYVLRLPGQLVYQAIVGGTLTDRESVDPFPVGECPDCRGQLTGSYHPDGLVVVECTDCDTLFDAAQFPPRGVGERSGAELLSAAYQRRHHGLGTMRRGVCRACGSLVLRSLRGEDLDGDDSFCGTQAVLTCRECNASLVGNPATVALTTPAVVGFFADHDRDAASVRWWEPPVAAAMNGIEVVENDPPAVATTYELDDERLRVVIDDDLQVASTECSPL